MVQHMFNLAYSLESFAYVGYVAAEWQANHLLVSMSLLLSVVSFGILSGQIKNSAVVVLWIIGG